MDNVTSQQEKLHIDIRTILSGLIDEGDNHVHTFTNITVEHDIDDYGVDSTVTLQLSRKF